MDRPEVNPPSKIVDGKKVIPLHPQPKNIPEDRMNDIVPESTVIEQPQPEASFVIAARENATKNPLSKLQSQLGMDRRESDAQQANTEIEFPIQDLPFTADNYDEIIHQLHLKSSRYAILTDSKDAKLYIDGKQVTKRAFEEASEGLIPDDALQIQYAGNSTRLEISPGGTEDRSNWVSIEFVDEERYFEEKEWTGDVAVGERTKHMIDSLKNRSMDDADREELVQHILLRISNAAKELIENELSEHFSESEDLVANFNQYIEFYTSYLPTIWGFFQTYTIEEFLKTLQIPIRGGVPVCLSQEIHLEQIFKDQYVLLMQEKFESSFSAMETAEKVSEEGDIRDLLLRYPERILVEEETVSPSPEPAQYQANQESRRGLLSRIGVRSKGRYLSEQKVKKEAAETEQRKVREEALLDKTVEDLRTKIEELLRPEGVTVDTLIRTFKILKQGASSQAEASTTEYDFYLDLLRIRKKHLRNLEKKAKGIVEVTKPMALFKEAV